MSFTDSLVMELSVGNVILTFEQGNGSMHVDTSVWSSSLIPIKFVERNRYRP
ncbi:hypothetical protein MUK42_34311 [Musa troglodytarum]|uniref:Uncharacterized protein n=1 Tax=Musa troglodytarum TaxID=320322 RepID=A0A9E7KI04_9LILI|nr:hypothetical protein MUK42_34311 [Musa troglodytarum]